MITERLPAQRSGAKALLLTVLGEFVLPAGGSAWTATLVDAAGVLGIGEKNARQALARIADDGLIESERHGRRVRWVLTSAGRDLLEAGAERIYSFQRSTGDEPWAREWLVVHCAVPEERRALRHQLRTRLSFLGFGELSPTLVVSPHPEREAALRAVLTELDLLDVATILRSRTGTEGEDAAIAAEAWDLDQLAVEYREFSARYGSVSPSDDADTFRRLVELVHDWRQFPFADPELPVELLPSAWAGMIAAELFHELRGRWSPAALGWFDERDGCDITSHR